MTSSATLRSKRLRHRVITRLLQRLTLPFIHHLRLFTIRPRNHDLHIPISTFLFLSKQKDCIKQQAREKHTVPTVLARAPQLTAYPPHTNVQAALNFPNGVLNPASACARSPNCGASPHVLPPRPVTVNTTLQLVNASVGPVPQPCECEVYRIDLSCYLPDLSGGEVDEVCLRGIRP
jgi:hypothetical protein